MIQFASNETRHHGDFRPTHFNSIFGPVWSFSGNYKFPYTLDFCLLVSRGSNSDHFRDTFFITYSNKVCGFPSKNPLNNEGLVQSGRTTCPAGVVVGSNPTPLTNN